ncbi:hypothetical protein B0J18DRAFT_221800 [Chaetomium sp. MPI-SDFR-AT-0129]|nr:hypothetical protein B0J18DRAFT_221800 [Chaetomium sp. MPI-SDFR-AT-0129]
MDPAGWPNLDELCPGRDSLEDDAPPELETGSNSSKQGRVGPLPWLLLDDPCCLETHCSQHGVALLFSSKSHSFSREEHLFATPPFLTHHPFQTRVPSHTSLSPQHPRTSRIAGAADTSSSQIFPHRAGARQPCEKKRRRPLHCSAGLLLTPLNPGTWSPSFRCAPPLPPLSSSLSQNVPQDASLAPSRPRSKRDSIISQAEISSIYKYEKKPRLSALSDTHGILRFPQSIAVFICTSLGPQIQRARFLKFRLGLDVPVLRSHLSSHHGPVPGPPISSLPPSPSFYFPKSQRS